MKLFLTKKAQKHFDKLNARFKKRALEKLRLLEKEPYIGKKLTGKFSGNYSLLLWPYRIIYEIDEKAKEIWVLGILHRQGVYK